MCNFCYIPTIRFQKFARAIAPKGKQWGVGDTIKIYFIGGSITARNKVIKIGSEWIKHANLEFDFSTTLEASDVRISFQPNIGSWSYIGTDALFVSQNKATMNFGWLDRQTILHEFGHMLSLGHEHQNPNSIIKWNRGAVISALSGPPNNWDNQTIHHNIFKAYELSKTHATRFDEDSIMLYHYPGSWIQGGEATNKNKRLSSTDIQFIKKLYPTKTSILKPCTWI